MLENLLLQSFSMDVLCIKMFVNWRKQGIV